MILIKLLGVFSIITNYTHALQFVEKEFQKSKLIVKTESGRIQGVRLPTDSMKNGYYYAFLGIPYAQPPIGDLRFRSPKWVTRWSGVLDGRRQGSGCIEIYVRIVTGNSSVIGEEDCLFLNVYTKTNPAATGKLKPVMFFIHGGGYTLGSSDIKVYGPDLLVSKDVVVVTFNYRLNILGFLSTEDMASPGNYGLKDQNLALRWVQKNIKYFGGDPNNVMLFGQSAGSSSVHFHMLSPKSKGLFHKALLESGSALCIWASQRKSKNIAYLTGLANGIVNPKDTEELVEKLRQKDINELKDSLLSIILSGLLQALYTGLPLAPVLEEDHEDAFLTKNYWYEMLKTGNYHQVPVLMGTNLNETLFFLQEVKFVEPLFIMYDLDPSLITPVAMNLLSMENKVPATQAGKMIIDRYFGKNKRVSSLDALEMLRYQTQDQFVRPLWKTAELMSQHVPVFFYEFRYESELGRLGFGENRDYKGIKGVIHAEELFFIFNKSQHFSKNQADYEVRERMVTLWTNFAKYSNPTPINKDGNEVLGGMVWPEFKPQDNNTVFLEIDKEFKIRNISDDYENNLWWDDLFDKFGKPPYHIY